MEFLFEKSVVLETIYPLLLYLAVASNSFKKNMMFDDGCWRGNVMITIL